MKAHSSSAGSGCPARGRSNILSARRALATVKVRVFRCGHILERQITRRLYASHPTGDARSFSYSYCVNYVYCVIC